MEKYKCGMLVYAMFKFDSTDMNPKIRPCIIINPYIGYGKILCAPVSASANEGFSIYIDDFHSSKVLYSKCNRINYNDIDHIAGSLTDDEFLRLKDCMRQYYFPESVDEYTDEYITSIENMSHQKITLDNDCTYKNKEILNLHEKIVNYIPSEIIKMSELNQMEFLLNKK